MEVTVKVPARSVLLSGVIALAFGCNDRQASPTALLSPSFSQSSGRGGKHGVGFNGNASAFPTGAVSLTRGGAYDVSTASNTVPSVTFVHSGGGFGCTAAVAQGP